MRRGARPVAPHPFGPTHTSGSGAKGLTRSVGKPPRRALFAPENGAGVSAGEMGLRANSDWTDARKLSAVHPARGVQELAGVFRI